MAGAVSRMSRKADTKATKAKESKDLPKPSEVQHQFKGQPTAPPMAPPPFKLADVRRAVPKHCFERNPVKGFMYLFRDFAMIAAIVYAGTYIRHEAVPTWARYVLWPVFWYTLGSVMTGVWVIAHECGHQAFSPSKTLNDAVGLVCHSALLVPYHSWRITHAAHHKNCCSIENDEVFVPATRSMIKDMTEETPIVTLFMLFNMLTFGWPGYLLFNFSGPAKYGVGMKNGHFNPSSPLFDRREYWDIVVSDIGLVFPILALTYAVYTWGFLEVMTWYGIPYLIVNAHLVLITFLQHTDTYIPHYRSGEFTWLRGALSTVDRSYSRILDIAFHHIANTHVCHHMFHTMPFYYAEEATEHIKKVLGQYYLHDPTPIPKALYRSWRKCRFVEDEGEYLHFHDH